MDVVLDCVYGLNDEVGPMLGQRLEYFEQVGLITRVEYLSPVFGRLYRVVVSIEYTMAHSPVHNLRMRPEALG